MPQKSPASQPDELDLERFYMLLPKEVREANQGEMNQILNTLRDRKTRKVNFSGLWRTLFWIPNMKSRVQSRHRALSEFRDRTGEKATQRTQWARKRQKILRDFDKLRDNVFSLYEELDNPKIYRLLAGFRLNGRHLFDDTGLLNPQDQRVLKALQKLDAAINVSPTFQSPPPSRPKGHQPELWLQEAKKRFKQHNVPQESGDQLLRLIGVKPDLWSKKSH